jgi:THO complex subunit 2
MELTTTQEMRIITPELCRERLELSVLAKVGLIADENMMGKKEIRMRTGLLCVTTKSSLKIIHSNPS